ncbi:MAG: glycoside hydrolase [candidate division Zixibacteria bacterium]|nr:glycoside hydrolase [candidate division Zixibacteria bacterium]
MQTKLIESGTSYSLGHPFQSKLFQVPSGPTAQRRVALVSPSPGEIALLWSDSPGQSWSDAQAVLSDCDAQSFDCRMDVDGHLLLMYVQQSTGHLYFLRLAYNNLVWTPGSPVPVYTDGIGCDPSLEMAADGTLWVSWSRYSAPGYTVQVKSSADNGATWGSGPADSGDTLSATATTCYCRLVADANRIHAVHTDLQTAMNIRFRLLSGGSWSDAYAVATGSTFTSDFDVAASDDGRLGVVFRRNSLCYREYDGVNWGTILTLDDHATVCPQISLHQGIPHIMYLRSFEGSQRRIMYTRRDSGTFSVPRALDHRADLYSRVVLYSAGATTFEELTDQAISSDASDIYHSQTGCLLRDANDAVYVAGDAPFRTVRWLLSTLGDGGGIEFAYWDGTGWAAVVPRSVSSVFATQRGEAQLWSAYVDIPTDWQQCEVMNRNGYWIRIQVNVPFTAGPIGQQLTAVPQIDRIIFRR